MVRVRVLVLALLAALVSTSSSHADEEAYRFCVIPVRGKATNSQYYKIPGWLAPIYVQTGLNQTISISENAQVIQYPLRFPITYLDNDWVYEPWSGRIVADSYTEHAILVKKNEDADFHFLGNDPEGRPLSGFSLLLLEKEKNTVIIRGGRPYSVEDSDLKPWNELGIGPGNPKIWKIYRAPLLNGFIVIAGNYRIYAVINKSWHELASLRKSPSIEVHSLPKIDATVIFGFDFAMIIRKNTSRPGITFRNLPATKTYSPEYH